ncbi:radical SAM protein [Anaerocolumna cellulosilytica]|uniref:Radical SAM protein n=1 Tax=Anaerocolumna cellulosilytica TaxID=433286 RepID=A0A6S6R2Q1_9FIRM|nr:radical SAM protein [Anaerocolumna cellulosilytica]MBB5195531.1 putative pyruvate formate lyase activating enzyme [Anaerocolumna cellulosilytica]BCJ93772.1 radical SAM protein [Anaerocolumna cellulosilytica]
MYGHLLEDCTLCPRNCHVNRLKGEIGRCRVSGELMVARAALHMWEEPSISGETGSGTVFFSGCSLGCVYCQNHNIAAGMAGKKITIERLAEIFLELQEKKANNINLVTPGHYVPQIMNAIELSKSRGLELPIVYNTSSYEKAETLKLLEGYIDIYLPDMKYYDKAIAKKYSKAEEYFKYASEALQEMVRQVGKLTFREDGVLTKGVIVRHLTLPGYLTDSKKIIKYLYETYGDTIYISIMNQYTPLDKVKDYPEINRCISEKEYEELIDYAIELGIENGFIQEGETALESFIPEFNEEGV